MSEIERYQPPTLAEQIEFSRLVVKRPDSGAASLLPSEYRDNPANVLIAVGLGSSMGLSPSEALYRIHVIKGKPTASGELIAANVRKAGHRLRVRVSESPPSCTATIVRADDPEYPFEVTRDMAWAKQMGLAGKDNYKSQPSTMLQWRAISAAARLACPEALYGVAYTADELTELPSTHGEPAGAPNRGLRAALAIEPSGPGEVSASPSDAVTSGPEIPPETGELLDTTSELAQNMYRETEAAGIKSVEVLPYISGVVGREIKASRELTTVEAMQVINSLAPDGRLL